MKIRRTRTVAGGIMGMSTMVMVMVMVFQSSVHDGD
eukprot:gene7879-biopygen14394